MYFFVSVYGTFIIMKSIKLETYAETSFRLKCCIFFQCCDGNTAKSVTVVKNNPHSAGAATMLSTSAYVLITHILYNILPSHTYLYAYSVLRTRRAASIR